jgi:hypothetical protein
LILNERERSQRDAGKELNQITFPRESRVGDRVLSIAEAKVVDIVARTADEHIVSVATL